MQAVVQQLNDLDQYHEGLEAALALALEEDEDVDEEAEAGGGKEPPGAAQQQPTAAAKYDSIDVRPTPSMPSAFSILPDVRVQTAKLPSAPSLPPLPSSPSTSFLPPYYLAMHQTQDILCRLLIYAGATHGKVSKRWERIKILGEAIGGMGRRDGGREKDKVLTISPSCAYAVVRERHVKVLLEKTKLPESLCRDVEGELYAAAQQRWVRNKSPDSLYTSIFLLTFCFTLAEFPSLVSSLRSGSIL